MATDPVHGRVHVQRLRLRNYRSVRECDVPLQPGVTFLVGPNGAGKSNILDGLRFISDALTTSLDDAVQARGGFAELRHRWTSGGVAAGTTVDITFTSPLIAMGRYLVQLDDSGAGYEVTHEQFTSVDHEGGEHSFDVDGGGVHSTDPALPLPDRGRLYLPTAANLPAFLPAFDALRRMGFYNLSPEVIRAPQTRGIGTRLARDGGNLAGMLELLARAAPHQKKLVEEYLALIAPGTVAVESRPVLGSTLYSLAFQEAPTNAPAGWFYAQSISDGTLRALGVLVALFQYDDSAAGVSVVGIEEPEAALHARAVAVLRDALQEAAEHRQVLVTTHSPELLDDRDLDPEALLAVEAINGATVVGPPDPVGLNTMQEHLLTAGELVRANQLFPAAGRE